MLAKTFRHLYRTFSTTLPASLPDLPFVITGDCLALLKPQEKQAFIKRIEDNAVLDYKVYPQLPHQDPKSKDYVHSELDQYHDEIEVKAYNKIIDQLKYDIKVQRQVWDSISKMDRPYKKGIRGIHTNLNPDGPTQVKLPDIGFKRDTREEDFPATFNNEDRFIANTIWIPKYDQFTNIKEWERERLHRPVTKNFNHAKGYKYDVPLKPQEKYEYVADRLGHSEFFGTPMERLFKLQSDLYHPAFVEQPFVKTPNPAAHPSLNFEVGDVIYENTRILEWLRGFQLLNLVGLAYGGIYLPLNIGLKTNLITDKADQLFLSQLNLFSPHAIDTLRLFGPITAIAVYYIVYLTNRMITDIGSQYAVKAIYSKDRELLFVQRLDAYGRLEEDVYETAHLEILPPNNRGGLPDLSSQDEDGIWRVTCMNTQRCILFYNDSSFWNRKLKDQFIQSNLNLWDKSYYGYNRKEAAENDRKWKQEAYGSLKQQALPK